MCCRRVVHEPIRRNQEGTASTTLTADALGTNPIHRTRFTRKPAVSKPSYASRHGQQHGECRGRRLKRGRIVRSSFDDCGRDALASPPLKTQPTSCELRVTDGKRPE